MEVRGVNFRVLYLLFLVSIVCGEVIMLSAARLSPSAGFLDPPRWRGSCFVNFLVGLFPALFKAVHLLLVTWTFLSLGVSCGFATSPLGALSSVVLGLLGIKTLWS